MSKSFLRKSKTNRSTLRRIEIAIRRGWHPGQRAADYYLSARRSRHSRQEAARNPYLQFTAVPLF
jgi:hypothetical protein